MKLLVTAFCVLGVLAGGVSAMYSTVTIGRDGLNSLSTTIKSIESVMTSYFKNLNAARSKIMSSINKLQLQVNTTYKSMNDSFGATQQNMANVISRINSLTQIFPYAERHYNYLIHDDLSFLNEKLVETMNRIIYNHYSHGISYSFQQNAEDCTDQFSSMATSLPNQLSKFGTCLKTSVDTVPTIVAPVQEIFELVRKDFISLNKQLNICAGSSINCITQYFMTIDMELDSIMSGITMAASMLSYHLNDSKERNNLCADLVSYNCEDLNEGLMRDFQRCIYPPV